MLTPLFLAAQLAASQPAPSPPYKALVSPTASARYAWEYGCLAAIASGTDLATVANPYIDPSRFRTGAIRTYRMTGAGPVVLVDGLGFGSMCGMRVSHGDPEALRAMVLEPRPGQGPWRPRAPLANDFSGSETFCGDIAGQVATLSIDTSKERRRPRLMAFIRLGPTRRCDEAADTGLSRIQNSR